MLIVNFCFLSLAAIKVYHENTKVFNYVSVRVCFISAVKIHMQLKEKISKKVKKDKKKPKTFDHF